MIRVLLVDPSNSPELFQLCEASGELSVSHLPEKTDIGEALSRQSPDIVIIHDNADDYPEIEILRKIRTCNTVVPVLFLTDALDGDCAARALSAGADYYLWDVTEKNHQDLLVPVIKNLVAHRGSKSRWSRITSSCGLSMMPLRLQPV